MITLSHSKREAYGCPYFFGQKYVSRTPAPKNPNLEEGTFLHDVICVYTEQLIKNKLSHDAELLDLCFKELWKAQAVLPESFQDSLYGVIRKFGERFELNLDAIVGAEYGIALTEDMGAIEFPHQRNYDAEDEWAQKNGVWIHSRLDRIEYSGTTVTVYDYKSFRRPQSKTQLEQRGQGKTYAWMVFNHPDFSYAEKVVVIFDFIRFDNAQVSIEYTKDDVSSVEKQLRNLTEKIDAMDPDTSKWPAIQNIDTCSICNFSCPLNIQGIDIPAVIQDNDKAQELAKKLLAIEREAKAIKDRLKVFTTNRSPVDVGIGQFGFQPSTTLRGLKGDALVDILRPFGVDVDQFIKVEGDTIKKMIYDFCGEQKIDIGAFKKMSDEELAGKHPLLSSIRPLIKGISTSTRFGYKQHEKSPHESDGEGEGDE